MRTEQLRVADQMIRTRAEAAGISVRDVVVAQHVELLIRDVQHRNTIPAPG